MSNEFTAIDLAKLPAPQIVETLDFETILADVKATFLAEYPDYNADLESDPVAKLLEVIAYREINLRQRVNDGARAVMLAYAEGSDLDNLAAIVPVERADGEEDPEFRSRVQLAPEAFSVAGPEGAYRFYALSASTRVKDASAVSPTPGDVTVTVLSTEGDGTAPERENVPDHVVTLKGDSVVLDGDNITNLAVSGYTEGTDYTFVVESSTLYRVSGGAIAANSDLTVSFDRAAELELVRTLLADEDVRPLTDNVTVQSATIINYQVTAVLTIFNGPDREVVRTAAEDAVRAYTENQHRLGYDITISGLHQALHQAGVQNVALSAPAANIAVSDNEAAYCTAISVTIGGIGV